LGLFAGCVLGGLEVTHGHLDAQYAFAAVAYEIEGLRADDLSGNRLPVSAALTGDDSSHDSSAGAGQSGPQGLGASHWPSRAPINPRVRDTVVADLRSGLVEAHRARRWIRLEHLETLPGQPSDRYREDDENRAKRGDNAGHADQVGDDTGEQ
jgi:hypothetical protein